MDRGADMPLSREEKEGVNIGRPYPWSLVDKNRRVINGMVSSAISLTTLVFPGILGFSIFHFIP